MIFILRFTFNPYNQPFTPSVGGGRIIFPITQGYTSLGKYLIKFQVKLISDSGCNTKIGSILNL